MFLKEWQMQTKSASLNVSNKIQVINLTPCNLRINTNDDSFVLKDSMKISQFDLFVKNSSNLTVNLSGECKLKNNTAIQINNNFTIENQDLPKRLVFYLNGTEINFTSFSYDLNSQKIGFSQLRSISFSNDSSLAVSISKKSIITVGIKNSNFASYSSFENGKQTLVIMDKNNASLSESSIELESCASYTLFLYLRNNTNNIEYILLTDVYPNGLSLFWQLIQIFVMTIGELMFSISGLSFAYSQVFILSFYS